MISLIRLPSAKKTCGACAEPLKEGIYSTIDPKEERKDFCPTCFEKGQKPLIWWKVPAKEKKALPIILTPYEEKLYHLFNEAVQKMDKPKEWIYFLAHYFKRRKLFVSLGDCVKEDHPYEIVELKETQEVFLIPKCQPTLKDLESIVEELKNVGSS